MRRPCINLSGFMIVALLVGTISQAAPINSVFNPNDFVAIGPALNVGSGYILLFDTSDLTLSINGNPAGTGIAARSESNLAELAVFTFGSINIGSGELGILGWRRRSRRFLRELTK